MINSRDKKEIGTYLYKHNINMYMLYPKGGVITRERSSTQPVNSQLSLPLFNRYSGNAVK